MQNLQVILGAIIKPYIETVRIKVLDLLPFWISLFMSSVSALIVVDSMLRLKSSQLFFERLQLLGELFLHNTELVKIGLHLSHIGCILSIKHTSTFALHENLMTSWT